MYWDYTYALVLIGALICTFASMNVSSTYKRFAKSYSRRNYKAEDVAALMLRQAGITDVRIEQVAGELTDHYSPTEKVLRLSQSVYGSTSVAAIGVAAHECGHAIQHHVGYLPLSLRSLSVPIANIGSMLYWPAILLGIILSMPGLSQIGVLLFCFVVFFQLITLPVEFNASRRAMQILDDSNILADEELKGARKVLNAAAMTYVAALVNSLLQLLRLFLLTRRRRR